MKNDYLIERKENFFTKVINFIRGLFKKDGSIQSETTDSNTVYSSTNNSEFMDYIKIEKDEDKKLLEMQAKFENKEILMSEMSDNDLILLKKLYDSQIEDLNKEIDNKKTKIGMLRFRLTGSVNKI